MEEDDPGSAGLADQIANGFREGGKAASNVVNNTINNATWAMVGQLGGGSLGNKLHHIFDKAAHNLGPVVEHFGNSQAAYNAIYSAFSQVAGNYTAAQLAQGIQVSVGPFIVTVRGAMVNGVARIGTFFIP
jgi:hypothetical protein